MAGAGHAKAVREPIAVCVQDAAGLHGGEENRGDVVYPTTYKCVYPEIERWMRKNHISIRKLSYLLGVWPGRLSNWLYGITDPRVADIWALISLTNIPFEQLFAKK